MYMLLLTGFTTIEGTIDTVCEELNYSQATRRLIDPETATKIDEFIAKLSRLREVKEPFQVVSPYLTHLLLLFPPPSLLALSLSSPYLSLFFYPLFLPAVSLPQLPACPISPPLSLSPTPSLTLSPSLSTSSLSLSLSLSLSRSRSLSQRSPPGLFILYVLFQMDTPSYVIKSFISLTTVILILLICIYHAVEVQVRGFHKRP